MALNFPTSPTLNDTFSSGGITWVWNGSSWTTNRVETTFDSLSDVTLTGAANNDLLYRSGGSWIDTAGLLTWDGSTLTAASGTFSAASLVATSNTIEAQGSFPFLQLNQTDGGTDEKKWVWITDGTAMELRAMNDASSAYTNAFTFYRSAQSISNMTFGNVTSNPAYNFVGTGTTTFGGRIAAPAGTAAAPSIYFGDTGTGFYRATTADTISVAINGSQRVLFDTNGITMGSGKFFGPGGSAAAPTYSFLSDNNSGMYSNNSGTVYLVSDGTARLYVDSTGANVVGTLEADAITINSNPVLFKREASGTATNQWVRIAKRESQGGRGTSIVRVYTTGGSHTPYLLELFWDVDWTATTNSLDIRHNALTYITSIKSTKNGTSAAYLEIYVTGTSVALNVEVEEVGYGVASEAAFETSFTAYTDDIVLSNIDSKSMVRGPSTKGVAFLGDPTTGPGAVFGASGGGTDSAIQINANQPSINFYESDAAADNKSWDFSINSESFQGRTINDANSVVRNWLAVERTGVAIDSITLGNGTDNTPVYINGSLTYGSRALIGASLGTANLNSTYVDTYAAMGFWQVSSGATNTPEAPDNANGVLSLHSHVGGYQRQFYFPNTDKIWHRRQSNGSWGSWRQIQTLDSSGNHDEPLTIYRTGTSELSLRIYNNQAGAVANTSIHLGYPTEGYGWRITSNNNPSSTYAGNLQFTRGVGTSTYTVAGYFDNSSNLFLNASAVIGTGYRYYMDGGSSIGMGYNGVSSYSPVQLYGSKNSYGGFYDNYSGVNMMWDSGGNGGEYREVNSTWRTYWNTSNSSMGLGASTTSASYKLYVTGAIYATGDVVAFSDERKKENIVTVDNALEKINKLRGVYYNKIGEEKRSVGVIAQEVEKILPEVVTHSMVSDDSGEEHDEYGVDYGKMVGLLIEAVKELSAEVKMLKETR